ncbi:MAG TPA: KTSC domain-containing protein [Chloroflexia bacterium]|nr:KTSC domain-containing protein [Chloroflexia bacterium]
MQRQPVDSTSLRSVGYDAEQQILEIEFTSGSVYQYFNVPLSVFEALMSASSKGTYHSQWIKYNFRYTRIG